MELKDTPVEILEAETQGYPMKTHFVFAYAPQYPRCLWKRKSNNLDFADVKVSPSGGTSKIQAAITRNTLFEPTWIYVYQGYLYWPSDFRANG